MAFTVETGTGVVGANSYYSVSDLEDYCQLRAEDISAYTLEQKQAALVISSQDYVDSFKFPGEKLNSDQGLALPTSEVKLNSDIQRAVLGAAVLQLKGKLFVSSDEVMNQDIMEESSKLGPLGETIKYSDKRYLNKYPTLKLDGLLRKYTSSPNVVTVRRA